MSLTWDGDTERVVIECLEAGAGRRPRTSTSTPRPQTPCVMRVSLTGAAARAFVKRAAAVVAAGRPPCPFCGNPLDPSRPHLPARQRPPAVTSSTASEGAPSDAAREGRARPAVARRASSSRAGMTAASNATLYASVTAGGVAGHCIYKPVAGERPLWDFPQQTLSRPEVAAYLVSRATGWDVVPPTVLRDGPFGPGSVQLWIDADDTELVDVVPVGGCSRAGYRCCRPWTATAPTSCSCTPTTRAWRAWRCSTPSSTTPTARAATCCVHDDHVWGVDHGAQLQPRRQAAQRAVGLAGRRSCRPTASTSCTPSRPTCGRRARSRAR